VHRIYVGIINPTVRGAGSEYPNSGYNVTILEHPKKQFDGKEFFGSIQATIDHNNITGKVVVVKIVLQFLL
jgi:hypothetical protein